MAEYIECEKYVKLNDIIETLEHEWGYEGMREDLYNLPTSDVVEVVRCKECQKWDTSQKFLTSCACSRWSQSMPYPRLTNPDDFCSFGERKEGEQNEN